MLVVCHIEPLLIKLYPALLWRCEGAGGVVLTHGKNGGRRTKGRGQMARSSPRAHFDGEAYQSTSTYLTARLKEGGPLRNKTSSQIKEGETALDTHNSLF
jgi:hypothetical protein